MASLTSQAGVWRSGDRALASMGGLRESEGRRDEVDAEAEAEDGDDK